MSMGKCKNTQCETETKVKRVYCSMSCRNYFVNTTIRNYSQNSKGLKDKAIEAYTPSQCLNKGCDNLIPYTNRDSKYCSSSCGYANANSTRKGIKYNLSEATRSILQESARKNFYSSSTVNHLTKLKAYDGSPKRCLSCNEKIDYDRRFRMFCNVNCKVAHGRIGLDKFVQYKQDALFKFSLNQYPSEFDFHLVEEYGWYQPKNRGNNIQGVSRDHMLSVREGYELGIDPALIAHPANCRLMKHSENISKNKRSIITEDELVERIQLWNDKYIKHV